MKAVAAADTSVLYPAGDPQRLSDVSDEEVKTANDIVGGIIRGELPQVRVLTNIEQETFDHIKDDGGMQELQERMEAWRTHRIDFRHPSERIIEAARDLVTAYDQVEFADGALIAYLNTLDTERLAVYTLERRMDEIFRNVGIEPVHVARNPFSP